MIENYLLLKLAYYKKKVNLEIYIVKFLVLKVVFAKTIEMKLKKLD